MFTLETRALRRASRELIRHGLDVDDRLQVPLPDTGRSGSATQQGLEQHQVFQMVEHAVHQARRLEQQAHRDWQSAPALLAMIPWELSDGPR